MEWPRIPLPGWPDGDVDGAADKLRESAAKGRQLAALLDSDTPAPGVTTGTLRPEIAAIAVPTTDDGHNMSGDDFSLTAGWGHLGQGEAVMPGQGRAEPRDYTDAERAAMGDAAEARLARQDIRCLPQRCRLLAKHPRRRMELQTGRLPGPKEMALLPRTQDPEPPPQASKKSST